MSYLKGRNKTLRSSNATNEYLRQNSRVKIDQNILNYLSQVNEKGKLKKISSLNEAKDGKISSNTYNGLNDNIHIDFERKNKARRSLLYLLNKMSGGTFCPQIIDYFKEIRELKKQEELLKEVKEEENVEEPPIIINTTKMEKNNFKTSSNMLSNYKNQILTGQNKNNYPSYNFTKRNEKDNNNNNINEEKSLISKHYARDFELKDLEKFIDSEEIAKMNGNKFNFNKEAQAKKKFLEEITIDEDDRYYQKKARRNEKKKFKEHEHEIYELEVNVENKNEKRNKVPNLDLNKLKLNRMNTISGGIMKENNFVSNKTNNININHYNATSEIIEEKGEKSSVNYNSLRKKKI